MEHLKCIKCGNKDLFIVEAKERHIIDGDGDFVENDESYGGDPNPLTYCAGCKALIPQDINKLV